MWLCVCVGYISLHYMTANNLLSAGKFATLFITPSCELVVMDRRWTQQGGLIGRCWLSLARQSHSSSYISGDLSTMSVCFCGVESLQRWDAALSSCYVTTNKYNSIFVLWYSDWLRAGWLRGRSSGRGRVKNFLFSMSSRPALGPNQPPIQWVPGSLSTEVNRQGREADYSRPASAEVKKMLIYTSTPSYTFMA
jgi:hypothetical protein